MTRNALSNAPTSLDELTFQDMVADQLRRSPWFALSAALATGVLLVQDQVRYLERKDLGLEADGVFAVPLHGLEISDRERVAR